MPDKLNQNELNEILKKKNLECLNLDEYKSRNNKLKFKHLICGTVFETSFASINNSIHSTCPNCRYKKASETQIWTDDKFKNILKCLNPYIISLDSYAGANKKIRFRCEVCNTIFEKRPSKIIYRNEGCPECSNKNRKYSPPKINSKMAKETKYLLESLNIRYEEEKTFSDCVSDLGRVLPFDFYLPDYNLLIELDGRQHYDKSSKYYSNDLIRNDNIKNNYCKNNNIKLIRIKQKDRKNLKSIIEVLTCLKF